MEEKQLTKRNFRLFVIVTKVLPILIAIIYFLNSIISYFHGNDILLNYIGSISLLPIMYLYLASYTFGLCAYYRMYLHYTVVINIINVYDYYIGIPISDIEYLLLTIFITIITLFIILYLKFFK